MSADAWAWVAVILAGLSALVSVVLSARWGKDKDRWSC